MTLIEQLQRASRRGILNVSALARAAGMNRQTLRKRIERGSPSFDEEEAQAVRDALAEDGIRLEA